MSLEAFIRDPREVPFLKNQVKKILEFAIDSSRSITIQENDDFGFMTIQFLFKQIQHAESVLHLVPRRDAGLIARTMIDGLYKLLWASREHEERAKLWRSFSVIHDWRMIQARLKEGIAVDDKDIHKNEAGLKEFGILHFKNPKPNSPDPYNKYWHGRVKLSDMAEVDCRQLYDGPYSELSDWEHWGLEGIGNSIEREHNRIIVNTDSDRITGVALLAAFQCLFETLRVADVYLRLHATDAIQALGDSFTGTMDSFYEK
ncbi:MAG: DUF5677 domain-containing protein [Candidatus Sulfotelmatobacter sp.]|jgi:uncharacterized protein DUF5677